MALISRDPFAREEIHRERVYDPSRGCSWCGNRNHTRKGRTFVYTYRVETDGGRKDHVSGLFCSESCRKSFG